MSSTSPEAAAMLALLERWVEAGWLRRLDRALAVFIAECDPAAPPLLLLASALLAQLEGRGHTCLPLDDWLAAPNALLAWPAPAAEALQTVLADLPAEPAVWRAALRASPALRVVGEQADTGQPLVLSLGPAGPDRLYWRRYWDFERQVAGQVLRRCAQPRPVDEPATRLWLDSLFEADAVRPGPNWQKLACALALRAGLTLITGGPGTGKTYTAARLLAVLYAGAAAPEALRVGLAAPTGKAAARLQQAISGALGELAPGLRAGDGRRPGLDLDALTEGMAPARTLHALLGARPDSRALRYNAGHPLPLDVLIVDEASMIHLEMMAGLLEALPPQASLILLGDKDQLASVEAGAVLGDLCGPARDGVPDAETRRYALAAAGVDLPVIASAGAAGPAPALARQTVQLRESRRFDGPIGELALAVNRGDLQAARHCLAGPPGGPLYGLEGASPAEVLQLALHGRPGAEGGYRPYLQRLARPPAVGDAGAHADWVRAVLRDFDGFRLLCAVREGEWGAAGLNRAVQQALAGAGLLRPQGEWYAGRPVMVTRNDPALGVYNGDIGIALPPASGLGLRVWFDDGPKPRSVGAGRLAQVETAFAMTVHKSQGSEFEHSVLVLPAQGGAGLSRELVYTGITRARRAFSLISGQASALALALAQPTRRASGLPERLRD